MKSFVVAGAIAASALAAAAPRAGALHVRAAQIASLHAAGSDRVVPFASGETLTYDVSWSAYLTAGTLVTTATNRRSAGGAITYDIVADGRTTPLLQHLYTLWYHYETHLDGASLLPVRAVAETQEGSRHRVRTTTFDRGAGKAHYEIRTATVVKEDVVVPPQTQDALSAMYALRAAALDTGRRLTMPVTDGGTIYSAKFDVGSSERLRTPAGELSAWKIAVRISDAHGAPVGRQVAIWIADNAQRWPVKMQAELGAGTFTLTLREAR